MGELSIRRNRELSVPKYQRTGKAEKQAGVGQTQRAAETGRTADTVSETLRELMGRVSQAGRQLREGRRTLQSGEAVLGFGVAALVFYVVAAALFVAGIGCILVHPAAGIGLLGGGCICVALGILSMLLVVFLAGKCVPGICQGIAYIFKKLFGDKGGAKA